MITEGQWKRWKDNSTTDDRLNTYVLSDIRQMLGEIERLRDWQCARLETDDAVRALSPPKPTEGMVGILIERVAKAPQHVTYDPLKIIIKPQDEYRIAISKTERDILIAALRAMPLQQGGK